MVKRIEKIIYATSQIGTRLLFVASLFSGLFLSFSGTSHAITYFSSTTFSGPVGDGDDSAAALALDSSGNIYVTGFVDVSGQGKDIWIGKFNPSLTFISSTSINGQSSVDDEGLGIAIDDSDNVFVTGYVDGASGDLWIGKFNTSLVLQSSITLNGSAAGSYDRGYGLTIDHSGNVVVAGILTETLGGQNLFVGKLTPALVWISSTTKIVEAGPGSDSEGLKSVAVDSSNNIYAVGFNDYQYQKILIMKFNSSLTPVASSSLDGLPQPENGYGITIDGNDNIYVTGSLAGNIWIGKFGTSLGYVAQTTISGGTGYGLVTDSSGNLYATGKYNTGASIWVAKYTSSLSLISSNTISGSVSGPNVSGYGIQIDGSNLYVAGQNYAIWLGKATPPDAPTISGTALGVSSIIWSWNNVNGETSFQIFSSTGGAVSPSLNANVTSWTESNLSAGTSYSRRVRATNDLGYSESSLQSVSTLASGPAAPTGFSGSALGTSSITWTWGDVSGETSYQVFEVTP